MIGQTGPRTGLLGAALGGAFTGLAVWAKSVNAAGGIQCHPIKLIQQDDGGSPSKAQQQTEDLITQKGAVALVHEIIATTLPQVSQVVSKYKVALVGGDIVDAGWNSNQYFFAQGSASVPAVAGAFKLAADDVKNRKMALLYCAEIAICGQLRDKFQDMAKAANVDPVLQQSMSITQTSYTSECQAAKDAGAATIFVVAEGATLQRIASSCKSLNYFPRLSTNGIGITPELSKNEDLRRFNVQLWGNTVPFVTNDTPGIRAFHAAMKQFAPSEEESQATSDAWVSGKLFEAALNAVGPSLRDRPVTKADVLDGLYRLKNVTLGGLTPPLTYRKGQLNQPFSCYFDLKLGPNGWEAPHGGKLQPGLPVTVSSSAPPNRTC